MIENGKTIRITTDNKIEVLEIPWTLEGHEQAIGANMCEVVWCRSEYAPCVMLVDECGLLIDKPINKAASIMYGIEKHGQPIVGDVILVEQEGPEILPLVQLEFVKSKLLEVFPFLEEIKN